MRKLADYLDYGAQADDPLVTPLLPDLPPLSQVFAQP